MDLIDLTGIAALRGVSRQRASQLAGHPQFPAPLPLAGSGKKVWDAEAVRAFFATDRPGGRPRREDQSGTTAHRQRS